MTFVTWVHYFLIFIIAWAWCGLYATKAADIEATPNYSAEVDHQMTLLSWFGWAVGCITLLKLYALALAKVKALNEPA
jgi:hypothetical protein